MPISTAAPATGRDITKRVLLVLGVAFATLGATPTPTPAPPPIVAAPPPGPMGYYMMQGNRVVSAAFPSAPACFKALATLMKSLPANTAPIVCAHRVP